MANKLINRAFHVIFSMSVIVAMALKMKTTIPAVEYLVHVNHVVL